MNGSRTLNAIVAAAGANPGPVKLGGARTKPQQQLSPNYKNKSLAGQKAALWRVTGGGTLSPLAAVVAIGLWQLAAAASEELYYRALLQNGAPLALASLSGSQLLGDAVALVATTALFAVSSGPLRTAASRN